MSTNYENENYEVNGTEGTETTECGSGNGKGLVALVGGGALLLGGLAVAGINKLKNKKADKADKPKKQKTKYKIVKVPVEADEEIVDEVETKEDVEEPKKGKKK